MFTQSTGLQVSCARCGAARELPEADRARWPAVDKRGAVTIRADEACTCGSDRVKIVVKLPG